MDESVICAQHLASFYLCVVKPANLSHLVTETLSWCLLLIRTAEKLYLLVDYFLLPFNRFHYFDQLCLQTKSVSI